MDWTNWLTTEQWTAIGAVAAAIATVLALLYFFRDALRGLWTMLREDADSGAATLTAPEAPRTEPTLPVPPPPDIPPGAMPERRVIGREGDLRALDDLLRAPLPSGCPPAVAILGPGGIGKTTLAREYLRTRAHAYAAVHWIDAAEPSTAEADLAALAADLGLALPANTPAPQAARAVLRTLAQGAEPRLLVYDNAQGPAALRELRPDRGRVHILVTSRDAPWPETHYREHRPRVLDRDKAAELLTAEADPGRPPAPGRDLAAARALAETLGDLPLALVMAGAWLRDTPTTPFSDYAERLDAILHGRTPEDFPVPDGAERTLAATIGLSLDRCEGDETALLNLFAHMAPEGLSADLLDPARMPNLKRARSDIPALLSKLIEDRPRLDRALAALARRSLLTGEVGTGFALHRLTAAVIRARLAPDHGFAKAAAAVLAAAYPFDVGDHRSWRACARLTPHVLALHALPTVAQPRTSAMDFLCNQTAVYLRTQGDLAMARALAETGLALKRRNFGRDAPETGVGHATLGQILKALGHPAAALPHARAALRISRSLGPAARYDLPTDLNNLATTLRDVAAEARARGREEAAMTWTAEARRLYREALRRGRVLLREADADGESGAARDASVSIAFFLNNLAVLESEAAPPERAAPADRASRLHRALRLARLAVAAWPDSADAGDPRHAFHRITLGGLHIALRDPAAALSPLTAALQAYRRLAAAGLLPPDHAEIRAAATQLALAHLAQAPPDAPAARALADDPGLDRPLDALRADAALHRPP